ncbi:hypothetical protein CKO11_12955 [Rhodobacter sp. TJ_12]|uniref:hypothetical protein n=1 Tax=Rhodobacter sp. TJ_12 TaxID=2029399 RepID=UPI001CBBEFF1|nr:hypothetical protein [Rhodobacter sp. TJ_12]MBZ4023367.1 hypothetical protein [Rhodobacter sp. TJ_12]
MLKFLRQFWRQENGSIPIEGLYGGLLLLGWYVIAFQFYDAFRMRSQALRATYTVGDLISRERNAIGPTYVNGLKKVFDYIAAAPNENYTWLRVSIISCTATPSDLRNCDGSTKQFTLESSYTTATNGVSVHNSSSINQEASRIPIMGAGDTAVIVESSYSYFPIFAIGDREMTLDGTNWTKQGLSERLRFSNFVVTRPRGPRTVWNAQK